MVSCKFCALDADVGPRLVLAGRLKLAYDIRAKQVDPFSGGLELIQIQQRECSRYDVYYGNMTVDLNFIVDFTATAFM